MGIKLTNNAFATLAAGINSSATSITLTSGQGARFPTLSAGDYFYATLIDTSNNLEIVKCTARSTDVLTVVRAQETTTARAYSTGDRIEIRLTAATFVDSLNPVAALGYTPVNKAGDTMTGTLAVPALQINSRTQFSLANLADENNINWNNVSPNSVSYALGGAHTNAALQGVNSLVVHLNTEGMGGTNDSGVDTRGVQLWFTDTPGGQDGGSSGRFAIRPKQGATWHPWEKVFTSRSFRRNFAAQSGTQLLSGTSWVDISGCSINVIPISTDSKFLIMARWGGYFNPSGDAQGRILRNGTDIYTNARVAGNANTQHESSSNWFVDTPSTLSTLTYKLQGAMTGATGTFDYGHGGNLCSILIMEFEG
jgi:hypothetical protein